MRYGERVLAYELDPRQRRFDQANRETVDSTALVRWYDSIFDSDSTVVPGVFVALEYEQPCVHLSRSSEFHLIEAVFSTVS